MREKILERLKITQLTPMQEATVEAARQNDVVVLSPTGSGKTLAFLLPVAERLQPEAAGVQALVLAPTRELALQIEQVLRQMALGYKVDCFYGGHALYEEKRSLASPSAVLIGTPGRLAAHLREGYLMPSALHTLVLDEFDKALELGFQEDMAFILRQLPQVSRRILTSATPMAEIPTFTGLKKPVTINYLRDETSAPDITVKKVLVEKNDKPGTLYRLLCQLGNQPTLVFCNQRDTVDEVSTYLQRKKLAHGIFHGKLEQPDRERVLLKFRNGTHHLLISTDLAARGLDIPEIENVVHYQLPDAQTFVHRNGRTARMQAQGTAYVLLHSQEQPAFLPAQLKTEPLPAHVSSPPPSFWDTVYISAGKKDKISKGDVAGWLLQKGGLEKTDLGRIEIQDNASFAAINRQKLAQALKLLQQEKLKGKKVKVERAM
ncbi:DEAD/DEAH box helicase [Rufibacter psychrotolerans]|uniref:DEAD/DEAH box helicase n=1 Tax=Rufibacter psychrotolerans TaxID=2812556 RepID=UPI001968480E|nr:DEAD/DEAH box helicase [Rufibacter sp. SYSU D00308]